MTPPANSLDERREQLLDEVLAAYLRSAQAGQAPARETLLEQHPDIADELARCFADQDHIDGLAAPLRLIFDTQAEPAPGRLLGDYELLERVAQGGMGVVWKARQRSLGRVVAVKVLRAGRLAVPADWDRFRLEARAVAALDHPNIIPIYEVGEHEGLPYFSMKFVEGGSLAGHQASPREAARLLCTIAHAVAHAHERGILHRDLKPANILLQHPCVPLVTDFGLSRFQADPRADVSSLGVSTTETPLPALTAAGALVGTPAYMAPELAEGGAPTTAADVYGLGTILYQLLTGTPPFAGSDAADVLRRVREEAPPPPGGDLDLQAVCWRCLEKDPARRYPGARALADDLDRYLAGQPVAARPAGRWRRLRLWCGRSPLVAGLTAALLTSFLAGFVLVLGLWWRAEEERRRAETNLDRLEQVLDDFCDRLSEQRMAAVPGLQPARREFLEAGLRHYQAALAQRAGDPRLRAGLAATYLRIGILQSAIGTRAEALAAVERARELYEELGAQEPDDLDLSFRLARSHLRIGLLQTGLGHADQAMAALRRAAELLERLRQHPERADDAAQDLGAVWTNLGNLHAGAHRPEQARACYQTSVAIREDLLRRHPNSRGVRSGLAAALGNLGHVTPDGIRHFERARELLEDLRRAGPDDAVAEDLARCLLRIGNAHCAHQRWQQALQTLRPARDMLRSLVKSNPSVLWHQHALASVCIELGHAHLGARQKKEAAACYREALATSEALHQIDPRSVTIGRALSRSCFDLAGVLGQLGNTAEAEALYLKARDLNRALMAAEPAKITHAWALALTLHNLAILWEKSRPGDALAATREACEHARVAHLRAPKDSRYRKTLSDNYRWLARLAREAGRPEEAVRAALARQQLDPDDVALMVQTAGELVRAAETNDARREGNHRRAVKLLTEAIRKDRARVTGLDSDAVWEPLRQRDDFRRLVEAWK